MDRFRSGELDVLVGTTVLEVGVDVPEATVMLILDADRFGLAQLHQLRGRVGRGEAQSYCILVSDSDDPTARARLEALATHTDGFELAELDLELRREGEVLGLNQSGLPTLRIASLRDKGDRERAVHARSIAERLLDETACAAARQRGPWPWSCSAAGWPEWGRARCWRRSPTRRPRPRRSPPPVGRDGTVSDAGRVIAGSARGTRLLAPGEGTRPMGDRVKETLFAILEPHLRRG